MRLEVALRRREGLAVRVVPVGVEVAEGQERNQRREGRGHRALRQLVLAHVAQTVVLNGGLRLV